VSVASVGGILLWTACGVCALLWVSAIRRDERRGKGSTKVSVNIGMLLTTSLVLIPVASWSPYHLLWMFPASVALGFMSLVFPFSLLSIPGRVFWNLCCFGVPAIKNTGPTHVAMWTTSREHWRRPDPPVVTSFGCGELVVVAIAPEGAGDSVVWLELIDEDRCEVVASKLLVLDYGRWVYTEVKPGNKAGTFGLKVLHQGRTVSACTFRVS
jgi:hypothetical protein